MPMEPHPMTETTFMWTARLRRLVKGRLDRLGQYSPMYDRCRLALRQWKGPPCDPSPERNPGQQHERWRLPRIRRQQSPLRRRIVARSIEANSGAFWPCRNPSFDGIARSANASFFRRSPPTPRVMTSDGVCGASGDLVTGVLARLLLV